VAIIDVSAYIEGTVEVAASGNVTSNFTLSNDHKSTFDFTCDGHGCKTGSGARPTTSTPVTTTESVQVEGRVSAKPGLYTALMLTLNVNVLGARVGPQPYLLGTAMGCGAATATQTNGTDSTGEQNAALAADLDWGVDFRAEALVGGKVVGNKYQEPITGDRHVWFKDFVPGGSSALRAGLTGPTEAATSQPTAYKLRNQFLEGGRRALSRGERHDPYRLEARVRALEELAVRDGRSMRVRSGARARANGGTEL